MNYEIVELQEKMVVGVAVRTNNNHPNMQNTIGALWNTFLGEGMYSLINHKMNDKSIGLYTNYESNHLGDYDAVVCCEVLNVETQPESAVITKISAGKYAKFIVKGHIQKAVGEFWCDLWKLNINRKFECDFEEYQSGGNMENAEIHIYISLYDEELKTHSTKFCQCCGMPMGDTDEMYGTNADGSKSDDYCKYCFENGAFTFNGTMEEMIEICVTHVVSANPQTSETEARKMMTEWFPTLKHWQK